MPPTAFAHRHRALGQQGGTMPVTTTSSAPFATTAGRAVVIDLVIDPVCSLRGRAGDSADATAPNAVSQGDPLRNDVDHGRPGHGTEPSTFRLRFLGLASGTIVDEIWKTLGYLCAVRSASVGLAHEQVSMCRRSGADPRGGNTIRHARGGAGSPRVASSSTPSFAWALRVRGGREESPRPHL